MSTLDDFFGDGSKEQTPECLHCGRTDGNLIVAVNDANGPTHWKHQDCADRAEAQRVADLKQENADLEWFLNHPSA